MALTKEEVREAFREAMARDYADVPPEGEIDYEFSPEFYAKMDALIAEQKRGSWRLLSRNSRRALIVAALLAISLILTACTPTLRVAFMELMVTIYETFAEFKAEADGIQQHAEIETMYGFTPLPKGFEITSCEWTGQNMVRSIFDDKLGRRIIITQSCVALMGGSSDTEYTNTLSTNLNDFDVFLAYADNLSSAQMFYDGYYFRITYRGSITADDFQTLLSSIQPID